MKSLSEKTLIPISFVITILGGVGWLTAIYYDTNANASDIKQIKQDTYELREKIVNQNEKVIERLSRIEENLKNLNERSR